MINLIAAIANNNVIGYNNSLPWPRIKEDMDWFRKYTLDNIVVMGRNTWDSLPNPLKNRINVVVTSRGYIPNCDKTIDGSNLIPELLNLQELTPNKKIFVIGGAKLYNDTIKYATNIYLTRIYEDFPGDTFLNIDEHLPKFKPAYSMDTVSEQHKIRLSFHIYERNKT